MTSARDIKGLERAVRLRFMGEGMAYWNSVDPADIRWIQRKLSRLRKALPVPDVDLTARVARVSRLRRPREQGEYFRWYALRNYLDQRGYPDWDEVPEDLQYKLAVTLDRALVMLAVRQADDRVIDRIEKAQDNTTGRNEHELETIKGRVRALEGRRTLRGTHKSVAFLWWEQQ